MADTYIDPDYTYSRCRLGIGSTFGYSSSGNAGSFTNYGEITEINLPSSQVPKLKATNMQSTGASQEYRPGLKEPGESSFNANLTHNTWIQANDDQGKLQFFQIYIPADGTDDVPDEEDNQGSSETGALYGRFYGFISNVGGKDPVDGIVTCEVKVTISGTVEWTNS